MAKKNIEKLDFEEALEELEKIVSSLEDRGIKLKDAMQAYERGQALREYCAKKLEEAENIINIVKNDKLEEFSVE